MLELSDADWESIRLVATWLKSFQSATTVTAGSEATADSVVPEVEAWLTFRLARRRMSLCLAKVVCFWDGAS